MICTKRGTRAHGLFAFATSTCGDAPMRNARVCPGAIVVRCGMAVPCGISAPIET